MKVLFAVQRLGAEGGMERFLDIVLPALVARGVDVHVLARTIETAPTVFSAQHVAWSDEHDAPDINAANVVRAACDAFAPDAVFAENVMDAGVIEALRSAKRFIYHVCDHRPFCPNGDRVFPRTRDNCDEHLGGPCIAHAVTDGCAYGFRARTLSLIQRRGRLRDAVAAADAILVDSRYMHVKAVQNGVAAARIVEISQPLADDDYRRQHPSTQRHVLFIGRFVPQKGLLSLIQAIGMIPEHERPRLVALGDGPQRSEAVDEARRLNVVLDAPGRGDIERVRRAIDEAAVVAFPSLWAEPFGRVGIEAFGRERPVIAYDVGGVTSWLHDGRNGLLVPAGDEAALAAAIARILEDEPLRVQLGTQARSDAESRRLAPFIDRLVAVIFGAADVSVTQSPMEAAG